MRPDSQRGGRSRHPNDQKDKDAQKARDVVCVGGVMVDVLFAELPGLPQVGEEFYARQYSIDAGGGGSITAVALAVLGLRVSVAATVGDDPFGRFLRERLASHGVDLGCLSITCEKSTAISMELTFPSNRATVTCDPEYDDIADQECVREQVLTSRHLHVGRLTPARVELLKFAASSDLTTSVDTKLMTKRQQELFLSAAPHVDILMPNQQEVSADDATVSSKAKELGRLVRRLCVIKRGNRGALASDGNTLTRAKGYPVAALDTTGAGDAFNAGFLYAFLKGHSIDQCLATGNAAGAKSVEVVGGVAGASRLKNLRA